MALVSDLQLMPSCRGAAPARAPQESEYSFRIFGHVLEAGGRAARDPASRVMMPLPFEKPERTLFVNAGSVNAVPYKMLDGTTSRGQAAVFTVEHGKGHVEFIALGRPRR